MVLDCLSTHEATTLYNDQESIQPPYLGSNALFALFTTLGHPHQSVRNVRHLSAGAIETHNPGSCSEHGERMLI